MEAFKLQDKYVTLSLLSNISNISFVKSLFNQQEFQRVYLNPELIIDAFQVSVALMAALNNLKYNKLITKNLSSEVILSLSASKNISKALKLFNSEEGDKMLLVTIDDKDSKKDVMDILNQNSIQTLPLTALNSNDVELIKKIYKISEKELTASSLLNSVVSRISVILM